MQVVRAVTQGNAECSQIAFFVHWGLLMRMKERKVAHHVPLDTFQSLQVQRPVILVHQASLILQITQNASHVLQERQGFTCNPLQFPVFS